MPAGTHNFTIEQGATFSRTLTWTDEDGAAIDLTGYSARMKVKYHRRDQTALLELTNGDGITLGGAAGTIIITISAADTAAIDWTEAVYDLELVSGAVVTRLLQGTITVDQEVTK